MAFVSRSRKNIMRTISLRVFLHRVSRNQGDLVLTVFRRIKNSSYKPTRKANCGLKKTACHKCDRFICGQGDKQNVSLATVHYEDRFIGGCI